MVPLGNAIPLKRPIKFCAAVFFFYYLNLGCPSFLQVLLRELNILSWVWVRGKGTPHLSSTLIQLHSFFYESRCWRLCRHLYFMNAHKFNIFLPQKWKPMQFKKLNISDRVIAPSKPKLISSNILIIFPATSIIIAKTCPCAQCWWVISNPSPWNVMI